MNKTFNYCNIAKTTHTSYPSTVSDELRNPMNPKGLTYVSLEDKIRLAQETGEDVSVKVAPAFDEDDVNQIDVLGSYNHDIIDIAELYGTMIDQPAGAMSDEPTLTE